MISQNNDNLTAICDQKSVLGKPNNSGGHFKTEDSQKVNEENFRQPWKQLKMKKR